MSTTIDRILTIQEHDRRISALSREQADIPKRQKQIESRLDAHREALKLAQEEMKKKTAAMKELELEIDAVKQKIKKFREQQLQIKSNTEYKALEGEVLSAQKEIRGLEDKELEMMENMEQFKLTIGSREQDLKKDDERVKQDTTELVKRKATIDAELEKLKAERVDMVKDVPAEWLTRYEKIFQRNGDFALVPVEHATCGGCHMKLPPSVVHGAKNFSVITSCNFCGRILYFPR